MIAFARVLRILAPVFFVVGALHLCLALSADVMLGARISPDVLADPALDSQNRFYGVAFTIYGVLMWQCASDVSRYAKILRSTFWVFFAAGIARLVSIVSP